MRLSGGYRSWSSMAERGKYRTNCSILLLHEGGERRRKHLKHGRWGSSCKKKKLSCKRSQVISRLIKSFSTVSHFWIVSGSQAISYLVFPLPFGDPSKIKLSSNNLGTTALKSIWSLTKYQVWHSEVNSYTNCKLKLHFCCCSVIKSCPPLRDPMDTEHQAPLYFTSSFSLSKFMSDPVTLTISSSAIAFSFCPQFFPNRVFSKESSLPLRRPNIWGSASESVLPMKSQCCFPIGLTDLISLLSKRLSRVFSLPFKLH